MAQYPNGQNNGDLIGAWVPVMLALIFFWPLGLILLFRKLMDSSGRQGRHGQRQHPYDIQRGAAQHTPDAQPSRKKAAAAMKMPSGHGLTIAGAVIAAIFGIGAMSTFLTPLSSGPMLTFLPAVFAALGFCGAGLVMFASGIQRTHKAKRFRKYLALIGRRECIPVAKLAAAMPVSPARALDDLQEMLDKEYIPRGYLDYASGLLMLTDEGMPEDKPEPEPAPAGMEREDAMLREIREVNDSIINPALSRKIDRVGEITGRIFAYLRRNPDKENRLRSFLSYYLPTTLKILRAYAQMEAQGIEGENITTAKERIEGMMDKVVEGFEKQLDRLFQDDVMDVTSDVAVLEQMLNKDGLSHGGGLQMGG